MFLPFSLYLVLVKENVSIDSKCKIMPLDSWGGGKPHIYSDAMGKSLVQKSLCSVVEAATVLPLHQVLLIHFNE